MLAFGNGSNLQAILDGCEKESLPIRVAAVISDRKNAYALERARLSGVPAIYHPIEVVGRSRRARREYDAGLAATVQTYNPDLVVLAGWMRLLCMEFLRHFPGCVINLHPALPGTFPGVNAIERAFNAFTRGEIEHTGVMVHFVPDENVDAGPVVLQQRVSIYPDDTVSMLENRIHDVEHLFIVRVIKKILMGED